MSKQAHAIHISEYQKSFLEEYAKNHSTTIKKLIQDYIQLLEISKEYNFHPDIEKISGIVAERPDPQSAYRDHIRDKQR